MLVALTGASGFIGSHIAQSLHRAGHEVRALVRRTSQRDHIAAFVGEFREGELNDQQALAGLVAGVDCVIHNGVDRGALQMAPIKNYQVNVLGSLELLEAARLAGVGQFIFVSSVAVHHEILPGGWIDENHPTWPANIYGAYKAAIESHLKAYFHTYGMNTSAWRPAAVYGIAPKLARSQWYDLIDAVRRNQQIDIAQGGKITPVGDVADALTAAVGDEQVAGQFYNLVDCYLYWQQVAEIAKQLTGSTSQIIDRKGVGPKNQFNNAKAIAFFDRHGNTTALRRGAEGVRDYVQKLLPQMP